MAEKMRSVLMLLAVVLFVTLTVATPAMASEIPETPANFAPAVSVTKTADKDSYEIGEIIAWTITVQNTSGYTAYDVVVVDEMTGDFWFIGALQPGAALSFGTATEAEQAGDIRNAATVSWDDGDEIPDEEEPEEAKGSAGHATVTVHGSVPSAPPTPQTPNAGTAGGEIEILDEEVPLASAPKTGDISAVWLALSSLSAGGAVLLGRKREENRE